MALTPKAQSHMMQQVPASPEVTTDAEADVQLPTTEEEEMTSS